MKIYIYFEKRKLLLLFPTWLLSNKAILKFTLRNGRKYTGEIPDISPAHLDALCHEIRRIKKKHTAWELLDARSADGEGVRIVL